MNSRFCTARWLLALAALLPLAAAAQTALVITNGVQTYGALTNFTITMSNRCELRVTATTNPIPSCTVNLTSADAWFFLPNIRPSVVSAYYLSQVLVNGSAAVAGSNCRLDEYAMGSVIVPQSPSYTPLQVFSGQNFLGSTAALALYTYYNTTAALGGMMDNISSFKLKRGYSCTFAQNADGTGASRVFIAQDGDLEVGVMPTNLDHQCSFLRVFPWRWTGKKGWGGTADSTAMMVDPVWSYDWGNGATSTLDTEYVPMQWGGGYSTGINSKQKSTSLAGFNEPDSTAQANLTVAQAIADWPNLMQSGLRLGAPGVSDSGVAGLGTDWLYSFISQADALGYRVDYVPVHSYKCGWSASQVYSYLLGIYQQTGRPIWLTEFNYGASWCTPDTVTQAQEATQISAYIDMLDSAPFVERYAIYQWFPTNRAMVVSGALTPAGVVYHNKQSSMAYTQTLPAGGSRSIVQFQFETNTLDSSGYGNNAFARGVPGYTTGHSGQSVTLDGTNSYLQLPPTVANSASFTFAAWVYWNGGNQWQRIFDFGDDTSHYLFLSPYSGGSTLRFAINNGSGEQVLNAPQLTANTWVHVAVTLSGSNAKLYTNGVLAASSTAFTIAPSNFNPSVNYLGKSQFADPLFSGRLDEVQIADTAFTAAQIAALVTNSPPVFTTNFMWAGTAAQGALYSSNISSTVSDPNPGDTQTFSKASGPAWLSVSAGGVLSGTPSYNDAGTNSFTVRVTDTAGASAYALVNIILPNIFTNGVWNVDASGSWNDTTKWSNNNPADGAGYTADFSTVNISLNRTVILDGSRSIGTLKFGDTAGPQNWTLTATNSSVLTLDPSSGSGPSIVVNQNTVTNFAPLAGVNGFTKSGAGTLVLATNNSLSGTLNVDTGNTTTSDGVVRVAHPSAIANVSSPINISDNNSGSSTLQLDGTAGNITVAQDITLNGRSASVVSIENLAGTNTLAGALTINVGGANYWIQSDAGLLTLSGLISSAATGTRTFTFQGAGSTAVSGAVTNGSATIGNLTKSGTGTLTLLGNNSYSGTTTISGGTLQVGNGGANGTLGTNNVANSGMLIFNSSAAVIAPITISGSGNVAKLGSGTLTFSSANSYTGGTLLAQGIIQVNSNIAFGTGTITNDSGANNARIILGNGVTATNSFVANTVNPGVSTGLIMVNDNTSATFTGPISILTNAASGGHFYGPVTSGLLSFTGPIKSGAPNFLIIRAGNVRFSGGGNYFEIQPRSQTTSLGANNGLATNAAVDLAGNGSTTVPTILDLNGFNQTLSGLKNSVTAANVAWVTNSGATTNTLTLDLNNGATNVQSFGGSVIGPIALTLASGTQTFTKTGASALNGLYTYIGNTTLNGGKLVLGAGITLPNTPQIFISGGAVLDASAANLNLGAAQTLTGSGALIGALTVSGTLAPGTNIGALSITGAVTFASGGKYICELASTTDLPGVHNDFLTATGMLTVSATSGSPFIIKLVASALAGWNNQTNYSWTLATGGSVSGFAPNKFSVDTSAFANNLGGGSLVVAQTGNSLALNFVPNIVPFQFTNAVFIDGGAFKLAAIGVPGNPYSLWSATNLASPINWLPLASTNADTNGLVNFSDALATNSPQKFYRLSSP